MSIIFSKVEILDRVKEHYGLKTNADLSRFFGVGPTTLSSWYSRNTLDFDLLFAKCVDCDKDWLLYGKEKADKSNEMSVVAENVVKYQSRYEKKHALQHVPLYRLDPTAGMAALFMDDRQQKPIGHIDIPNLPKCDGATYIVGDSMYPLLKSGDIILYKKITTDNIVPGEMYMIDIDMDGDDYVTVKYVHKSEIADHIKLVSQNQHHDPVDVLISKVRSIAIVKASIRFNTIR